MGRFKPFQHNGPSGPAGAVKRFIGCQIGNGQKFEGPPEQEYMKLCRKGLVGLRWQWLRWGRIGLGWAAD